MQEFKYKEEYKYLSNIMLCVTDACNLACRYCFVKQQPHYMDLQTAKDIADYCWNNYQIKIKNNESYNKKCSINFFGGEPMLMFDSVIKPLVQYCNEKKYDIDWGMTTNGTLLNEERIKFLHNNKVGILLSIDGFKPTQDYNRPCQSGESSFDKIFQNIPILLEYYPNITFRSTIYEDTVENLFENYLFAEKIGFKKYFCIPDIMSKKWTKENLKILEEQIHYIFEYRLLQYLNNKQPISFSKIDDYYINLKKYLLNIPFPPENMDILNRCGLATGLGAIGYDGSIYGCQEWTSQGNNTDHYLGNIYNKGIEQERHEKLLKKYYDSILIQKPIENDFCNENDCKFYNICKRYYNPYLFCHSQNEYIYQNMNTIDSTLCKYNQIVFDECLATFQILTENDNELFKKYFENLAK